MSMRKSTIGLLGAALFVTALPAAAIAQDEAADELGASPEGVAWTLTATGETPVPPEVGANLFMEDGEANGSTGCNSFSGTYEIDGASLSFDENFAVTQAFCEGEPGEVEQAYLAALPTVASWSIEGTELTLLDGAGATALTFEQPVVEVTETDVAALDTELRFLEDEITRLEGRINNTRQDVRQLNVPELRDRVEANEEVLEEVTRRFINVRERVVELERQVRRLNRAVGLEAESEE
jgi:heat shock protein HslJ